MGKVVLLDFDGPVCDVFKGVPASLVARKLWQEAESLAGSAPRRNPSRDPLDVLREFALAYPNSRETYLLDQALERMEIEAVDEAAAAPGSAALIEGLVGRGIPWGIATNNSEVSVRRFLNRMGWEADAIEGRVIGRPDLMKPNPDVLVRLLAELNARPQETYFLGDSPSDIQAARACGVHPIGHANKPGKGSSLRAAGAELVIESPFELLSLVS